MKRRLKVLSVADKTFQHVVTDASDYLDSVDKWAELPASISMSWSETEGFWLSANREGCVHLAKVFAELALGDHEDGTHFHVDSNFGGSGALPEFSFELNPDLAPPIPMEPVK